jgi:hypothetical protein
MPSVYVSGKFKGTVELEDTEYPYSEWTDDELAKKRESFKKPNLILWLKIENEADPISPLMIDIQDLNVYEGVFKFSQVGMLFTVEFDGKAKPTVHKDTKVAVDAGKSAQVDSMSKNGASHSFSSIEESSFVIQSKKL